MSPLSTLSDERHRSGAPVYNFAFYCIDLSSRYGSGRIVPSKLVLPRHRAREFGSRFRPRFTPLEEAIVWRGHQWADVSFGELKASNVK